MRLWLCRALFVGLITGLYHSTAMANFGFGPCCPPSTCGIIPCDSGCAGSALNQMGSNVSSALNNLNTAQQDLSSAVQDAIDSMNNLNTDINDGITQQNIDLLNGLSASTNKIELAYSAATKTIERNSNHAVRTFKNALVELRVAESTHENNQIFGENAQPLSGAIGSNRALSVQELVVKIDQLLTKSTTDYLSYLSDINSTVSTAGKGQHRVQMLNAFQSGNGLNYILTGSSLDDDQFQVIQQLIGAIVSKYPIAVGSQDDKNMLNLKRQASSLSLIYESLLYPAALRKGLVNVVGDQYYQDIELNSSNQYGFRSMLSGEVRGKLADPEWYGSVLRLNEAGLSRERLYQQATSNVLKNQLSVMSRKSNELMAILISSKAESSVQKLKESYRKL